MHRGRLLRYRALVRPRLSVRDGDPLMSETAPAPAGAAASPPRPAPAAEEDPQAKASRLETELQHLRSELRAGGKAVMRVLPPPSSLPWAAHPVPGERTEVPASAVPGLTEAAVNAGVNLIQEHCHGHRPAELHGP